jgi:hypothetical protein
MMKGLEQAAATPAPPPAAAGQVPAADPFVEFVKMLAPVYVGDEHLRRFIQSAPALAVVLLRLLNFGGESRPSVTLRPRPPRGSAFFPPIAGLSGFARLVWFCWRRRRLVADFPGMAAVPAVERRGSGARLEDPFRADEPAFPTARTVSLLHSVVL